MLALVTSVNALTGWQREAQCQKTDRKPRRSAFLRGKRMIIICGSRLGLGRVSSG